jgi:hypothetical protein
MPRKQLLLLLPIAATIGTLIAQVNHQSTLAASAAEVGQQQGGQETAQANPLKNRNIPESWIPRCAVAFAIGGYIIYSRKKQQ